MVSPRLYVPAFWGVLLLLGCDSSDSVIEDVATERPISIVTTTGMVRDMVSQLVGQEAQVEAIMGPGVDPHLYQPTRRDSLRLLGADIVVCNGLHLEGRLGEILQRRETSRGGTISVGELLDEDRLLSADAGLHDPHIWMDVALWSEATDRVAQELIKRMPKSADGIQSRHDHYKRKLEMLDTWGSKSIATIPESQRVMITAHDAFRYFGKRYGVEVFGVQGISTVSEAAISDTNRLVDLIVERKVPAVFFETSVSPRQVKAIVEGAVQRGMKVSSDATLLSDSMGADGTDEANYIGMMTYNFRTITEALGGTPPELPDFKINSTTSHSTTSTSEFEAGQ